MAAAPTPVIVQIPGANHVVVRSWKVSPGGFVAKGKVPTPTPTSLHSTAVVLTTFGQPLAVVDAGDGDNGARDAFAVAAPCDGVLVDPVPVDTPVNNGYDARLEHLVGHYLS